MNGIAGILELIFPLLNRIIPDVNERARVQAELAAKAQEIELAQQETIKASIEAQAQIITAEAASESWMARNWRPLFSMAVIFGFFYGIFVVPVLVAFGVPVNFPRELYVEAAAWWLSIYGGGHTVKYGLDRIADALTARANPSVPEPVPRPKR